MMLYVQATVWIIQFIYFAKCQSNFCLNCQNVVRPRDCDFLKRCGSHEVCYTEQYINSHGFDRYNVGCKDRQQCGTSPFVGRRGVIDHHNMTRSTSGQTSLCTECCTGPLCNAEGCGSTGYGNNQQRGPLCFNCDEQLDMENGCDSVIACGRDEVCKLSKKSLQLSHDRDTYETSCEKKQYCDAFFSHHTGRKRYDQHYLTHGGDCQLQCCESDLCNTGCGNPAIIISPTHPPVYRSDCKKIFDNGEGYTDGVYTVQLAQSRHIMSVYCDMTTDGGGWTVFQHQFDGSEDFYRSFVEYENGFGSVSAEFWMGLKYLYEMIIPSTTELSIVFTAEYQKTGYATFQDFYISSGPSYTLHIGISHRNFSSASGGFNDCNGNSFSTWDKDNDDLPNFNLAKNKRGGWWYGRACRIFLNAIVTTNGSDQLRLFYDQAFGNSIVIKTKMMFRRV